MTAYDGLATHLAPLGAYGLGNILSESTATTFPDWGSTARSTTRPDQAQAEGLAGWAPSVTRRQRAKLATQAMYGGGQRPEAVHIGGLRRPLVSAP